MMKKQYESPEVKAMLFVATEELAFSYDDLENLGQNPQTPGPAAGISGGDVMIPLD